MLVIKKIQNMQINLIQFLQDHMNIWMHLKFQVNMTGEMLMESIT